MKPLLLVDYDGTLCFDGFWQSLDPELFAQVQQLLFTCHNPMLEEWMRGKLSSEQINRWLAEKMSISFEHLWEVFVANCKQMKVRKVALVQIAKLRAQFTVILLTDNMDCFTRFTVPELRLAEHFDSILNSADHGVMKADNDGDLFKKLAAQYRQSMKNVWLVDNSTSACCTLHRLGGNGCLVTADESVEVWLERLNK